MEIPPLDQAIGIRAYSTSIQGIGGKIKREIDHFQVEEVLVPGQFADFKPDGDYLLCRMTKFGLDTFHALDLLRSRLGCARGSISVAGIKDARAVTHQYLTLRNQSASKVERIRIPGLNLEPLGYVESPITSTAISANRFLIKVSEVVSERIPGYGIEELRTKGFANFFGYQRFGSRRPITHEVGRELVKRDFQAAVECFISRSFSNEPDQTRLARDRFQESGDSAGALEEFPTSLRHERTMLKHLTANPGDFIGALRLLPLRLLKLLVHAYQAYLFNLQLSGLLIELGDLQKAQKRAHTLTVPGYLTSKSGDKEEALAIELLKQEDISPRDFYIGPLWQASSPGAKRNVTAVPSDLILASGRPAELEVSFELQRGAYATILLRELMKPEDPVAAGF